MRKIFFWFEFSTGRNPNMATIWRNQFDFFEYFRLFRHLIAVAVSTVENFMSPFFAFINLFTTILNERWNCRCRHRCLASTFSWSWITNLLNVICVPYVWMCCLFVYVIHTVYMDERNNNIYSITKHEIFDAACMIWHMVYYYYRPYYSLI